MVLVTKPLSIENVLLLLFYFSVYSAVYQRYVQLISEKFLVINLHYLAWKSVILRVTGPPKLPAICN